MRLSVLRDGEGNIVGLTLISALTFDLFIAFQGQEMVLAGIDRFFASFNDVASFEHHSMEGENDNYRRFTFNGDRDRRRRPVYA
jgi:hypothetical protein